ncbi:TPA: hypothetical protein UL761_000453 [Stenotrophomonas maltophilia]|nr:hypothetical protein [Stenotrophomonas maltophilia]
MNVIAQKFNEKINSLRADFEVNRNVFHNGVKGGLNEAEITNLIKEVIPQRFRTAKGIIENANGKQSNETDIFIYDDDILPPYIKNDLAFVPVEAVKYVFEVKSTLDANELRTTIKKFNNFKSIGGRGQTALFSFSTDIKGSEILRYKASEDDFFVNPAITILCASNKSYYYKETETHFIKDHLPPAEFMKLFYEASGMNLEEPLNAFSDLMKNDAALNAMPRSAFAMVIKASVQMKALGNIDGRRLTVNGIDYDSITFKVHKWMGFESSDNSVDLAFLSGVSNSLSRGSLGSYLLTDDVSQPKAFSVVYEDMWGNLSAQDFDEKGLSYNPAAAGFTIQTGSGGHKITFEVRR